MDGDGWHKSDKLIFPRNIRIIIQPPCSPELNNILEIKLLDVRLLPFLGLTDDNFILHLKESEFRFSNRKLDFYTVMLKVFRDFPL